jgi:hypothetical protein
MVIPTTTGITEDKNGRFQEICYPDKNPSGVEGFFVLQKSAAGRIKIAWRFILVIFMRVLN